MLNLYLIHQFSIDAAQLKNANSKSISFEDF